MPEIRQDVEDSDSIPSGLDGMSDDDSDSGNDSDGDDSEVEGSEPESLMDGGMPGDLGDSDEPLEFGEDEDDLIELSEGAELTSDDEPVDGKRKKAAPAESKREKRRKLRQLPTFASAEDYAKMIDDAPEDDI